MDDLPEPTLFNEQHMNVFVAQGCLLLEVHEIQGKYGVSCCLCNLLTQLAHLMLVTCLRKAPAGMRAICS